MSTSRRRPGQDEGPICSNRSRIDKLIRWLNSDMTSIMGGMFLPVLCKRTVLTHGGACPLLLDPWIKTNGNSITSKG